MLLKIVKNVLNMAVYPGSSSCTVVCFLSADNSGRTLLQDTYFSPPSTMVAWQNNYKTSLFYDIFSQSLSNSFGPPVLFPKLSHVFNYGIFGFNRLCIMMKMLFQRVGTSCCNLCNGDSDSLQLISSAVLAELCLKCPTTLWHLANNTSVAATLKPWSMLNCKEWAMHGLCGNLAIATAEVIFRALSVITAFTLLVILNHWIDWHGMNEVLTRPSDGRLHVTVHTAHSTEQLSKCCWYSCC